MAPHGFRNSDMVRPFVSCFVAPLMRLAPAYDDLSSRAFRYARLFARWMEEISHCVVDAGERHDDRVPLLTHVNSVHAEMGGMLRPFCRRRCLVAHCDEVALRPRQGF